MEAGDRAPDAPDMLHLVALGESDLHPKMLFCLYRPWYHTVLAFAPSHANASSILGELEAYDSSSAPATLGQPLSY